MAKEMAATPMKSIETITIKESTVKGISKQRVDDIVNVRLRVKIIGVSRDTWEKNKPLEAKAQILSGSIGDAKAIKAIKGAKSIPELEKAAKEE